MPYYNIHLAISISIPHMDGCIRAKRRRLSTYGRLGRVCVCGQSEASAQATRRHAWVTGSRPSACARPKHVICLARPALRLSNLRLRLCLSLFAFFVEERRRRHMAQANHIISRSAPPLTMASSHSYVPLALLSLRLTLTLHLTLARRSLACGWTAGGKRGNGCLGPGSFRPFGG